MMWDISDGNYVSDYKTQNSEYYIRACSETENPDFGGLSNLFPESQIQKNRTVKEIFFITNKLSESELSEKINSVQELGYTILSKIRIL